MEEVRQLVQEEGREARNLVAFHVAVDTPSRISRKPPRAGPPLRRAAPRAATRLRSASAGRDKRSELRARYWALLFGDLQRSIGEIYNTVEAHENLNECQEVILVLENYTRDFKALGEWFRLKWEYDNTPPPQRPQSLAWEIRKTDFVRPESRRAYSVKSSPSVSGKNSPCLSGHNTPSGKNSPNLTGKASPGSGKISPRITGHSNTTSPKANIEFFSSKIASKITAKPEPKSAKDISRLSDIKEKEVINVIEHNCMTGDINFLTNDYNDESIKEPTVEIGKAKECPNTCPKMVVIKSPKRTVLPQDNSDTNEELSSQAKATIAKLDAMENEFLAKQMTENVVKHENQMNLDKEIESSVKTANKEDIPENITEKAIVERDDKESNATASPAKSEDNFADVSNESSCKSLESDDTPKPQEDKAFTNETASLTPLTETNIKTDIITENIDVKKTESLIGLSESNVTPEEKEESNEILQNNLKEKKDTKNIVEKQHTRAAYSQAAAKPKPITVLKPELKNQARAIARSKTVVEIRPSPAPKTPKRNDTRNRNQTNKCSYPFNLTTGRTSLFDGPAPSKPISKKPANRMMQVGSGDSKNTTKADVNSRNRPPRPTTLKINEKGDKKENGNSTLENIKDFNGYGSSDTIVTQIDISRIESSESLKTLVPEEADFGNSIEVLNVDKTKNDDDGWLTVKSRRLSRESKKQSKSHWGNRFHQPSATTSLPTLNMIESPKQEINEIISSSKLDRAKSEQPQNIQAKHNEIPKPQPQQISKIQESEIKPKEVKLKEMSKSLHETSKSKEEIKAKPVPKDTKKDLAMIRQKSDVTGLKTRSSKSKALRKEKIKDIPKHNGSELTKNRLHSSLESLTTGLARSQESTQETFDFDRWKAEFKTTFNFLEDDDQMPNHNEILKSADPSEMSEIAEMTSQIEENEKKISWALDFQSEVDQRKLCEEEDLLNRQIMELQQVSDIDLDTETDDTETDAEILCEDTSVGISQSTENLSSLTASLEDQYETALAGMSWAERVDTLGALEALVARDPGRAQQLHAKLSQGIKRRGSLQDALRRLQAKQARAERQRIEYQTERAKKIHQLLAKVEEVKVAKNQLIEEKRLRMERRLQKATENRDQHLKDIVRKAHDEEEKLREIAFIKQLEAENRRHEFLDQCRSHTTRLRQMRRDRLSKLEQKAAREAAVCLRRAALEAARRAHVETLLERRKQRDARRLELKELKRQERDDAAREKAEGVKSRLSALAAAAELEADALRSRIRDKQDASQQRLESHLQAIREKATGPRQATSSESQDHSGKEEKELEEEAARLEQERKEREKQKAIKKKARKVRQKLLNTSNETIILDEGLLLDVMSVQSTRTCKVIHSIQNNLLPLLEPENNNKTNGIDCDDNGKKKNNKKNKKICNGNAKQPESNNNKEIEKNKEAEKNKEIDKSKEADKEIEKKKEIEKNEEIEKNKIAEKIKEIQKNKELEKKKEAEKNIDVEKNKEVAKIQEPKTQSRKIKIQFCDICDKPRLTKSPSCCPPLSDVSRGSGRGKGRMLRNTIDMPFLERQFNELNRLIDKYDKTSLEKSSIHKVHAVKVLGLFLTVVAEREDLGPQITYKSLITSIMLISRMIATCPMSAAYFISTNVCVHVVKLLSNQMEKNILADLKEMDISKQLTDCLSVGLDSVLCATRLYEESKDIHPEELEVLSNVRSRAHTLISYLCLSGCITGAEKAGEVRESIQTLLTVCADVCRPCELDVTSERLSAIQSLRCALGTSVCGSRAEFCMLFAQGAGLEHSGGFVRAARTAHLLRALAELDHQIVQDAFGEGGWPLEFRAAVARLLSQHAPNDKEAPRTVALRLTNQRLDQTLSETMVLDLIVLVGFVVVNNPQLQETICDGWSVIKTLCTLPANWLVSRLHSHALLPTLVVLSDNPAAAASISSEVSTGMLDEYMKSPDAQKVKLVQVIKQGRSKKGKK